MITAANCNTGQTTLAYESKSVTLVSKTSKQFSTRQRLETPIELHQEIKFFAKPQNLAGAYLKT
jgi:hypothetical protein